ncbi:hypothetical protein [Lignipirellula cremea]|uniref:Uncharacterized protein n=1 Tax=Lignipirellula cremea TaxID=2528010 RepID=A0A518DP71_9BACT|nr:hypothetical protein [Lignipirellula cremea]QDU93632.1 hypothetical protein Pla8534_14120 [Lignipirellula cremea]
MDFPQLLKKLLLRLGFPEKQPELLDTWEVSAMSDPVKFMDFIFSVATPEDVWQVDLATRETFEALRRFEGSGNVIQLTPTTVSALRPFLPSFDFDLAILHHRVTRDDDFLMVSYDNLSCCWVSKRVSEERMQRAARECGFQFKDTKDA